jgi:hypothetical protein
MGGVEQRKIVFEKWDELINELSKLLVHGKTAGGTMGHKIGSMMNQQKKLKDSFKKYV